MFRDSVVRISKQAYLRWDCKPLNSVFLVSELVWNGKKSKKNGSQEIKIREVYPTRILTWEWGMGERNSGSFPARRARRKSDYENAWCRRKYCIHFIIAQPWVIQQYSALKLKYLSALYHITVLKFAFWRSLRSWSLSTLFDGNDV